MAYFMFRPLGQWAEPADKRVSDQFRMSWDKTLKLLRYEVDQVSGDDGLVVIEVDVDEGDVRQDGQLRAQSKVHSPRVAVTFTSKYGPLRYATDRFTGWRANVHAIALGLENLRRLDRFGINARGQAYTGWQAIGPGGPVALGAAMSMEDAARYICTLVKDGNGIDWSVEVKEDPSFALALFKDAAKLHHPDVGGDEDVFKRLTEARDILQGAFP